MKFKFIFLTITTLALAPQANSEEYYIGGQLSHIDIGSESNNTLSFIIGRPINHYFAIEGHIGSSVFGEQTETGTASPDPNIYFLERSQHLNEYYALYGVFKKELPNDKYAIIGKLGFAKANLDGADAIVNTQDGTFTGYNWGTESGLSYGLGIAFETSANASISLAWNQLLKFDDTKINGLGLTFQKGF